MAKIYKLVVLLALILSSSLVAQTYTVSGVVTNGSTGEELIGANVYIQELMVGAASAEKGYFEFKVPAGRYSIVCSYIGFETVKEVIKVNEDTKINFTLNDYEYSLTVEVIADRAQERQTPVAFSNIDKAEMETALGSQDIPLVLNTTPSVYSTMQGGGAGDARINVRGFDQRNVAIMINGIPINDMENGWVYWSNWDGLGDATSSIQVQRGLSAVNLATPSIGGTMNIVTDPTAHNLGFKFKQEFGNDAFLKSSLFAHSGLIDNKFAVSAGGVRKIGDGTIDKAWTDAWAYYFGASYNINKDHRLEFYALGAPQRHGQNLYKQNAAAYSHEFAKEELGYSQADLDLVPEMGRTNNPNWNTVNSSYNGQQYWNEDTHERYDNSFINERENYYHKPLANLNWYARFTNTFSLYTTLYYSGGMGGGSGTYGSLRWNYNAPDKYAPSLQRYAAWDETITRNENNVDADGKAQSLGILRNSTNNQWTIGAISKAYFKLDKNVQASVGIDWRTAEIEHFREVRDLLGGDYFIDTSNDFDVTPESQKKELGDKIAYFNTNTVDWLGFYGQLEYSADQLTTYGMFGWSTIKYGYTNHFRNENGSEYTIESDNISGYQVKGGASLRATEDVDVYANLGYVSKVPIFDQVINDGSGALIEDPQNETFVAFEMGINTYALDGKLNAKLNGYYTQWNDRATSRGITNQDGTDGLVLLRGLDQNHMGVELEVAYQPVKEVRFDAMASISDWKYTDDVASTYEEYSNGQLVTRDFNIYIKDVKVGDAPQTQFALTASLFPIRGLMAQFQYRYYASHYSAFDPFSREAATEADADRAQTWEAPSYGVFDFHASYKLPVDLSGVNIALFAHVFNLFDTIYVQDAVDNSSFNALPGYSHAAQSAEVYLGLPRTFNLGISLEY